MQHSRPASSFSDFAHYRAQTGLIVFSGLRKRNQLHSFFSALQQKHKRFHKVVYRGTLTSKRLHSRVEEAIHLVQYQPTSECEITYHARAVVGHILYYLMEYSLLSCRSAET